MSVIDRFRLDGKHAIVTGASTGIGRAIAEGLADAGADVTLANRTAETGERAAREIAEATGAATRHVTADVSERADVERLVERAVSAFGGPDVLVNNAGIVHHTPIEDKPVEEFRETIEVNLTGAFLCAKAAGVAMIDSGGGSIVNVSSMSAFVANYPQCQTDYQASKGGLEAFKLQLASEWADRGVRVNNIAPGYINTGMVEEDPNYGTWREETLQGEIADPEAVVPLAVYLASDASAYVTGETVVIDGGYTVR